MSDPNDKMQYRVLSMLMTADVMSSAGEGLRRMIIATVYGRDGYEKLRQTLVNVFPSDGITGRDIRKIWEDDAEALMGMIYSGLHSVEQIYLRAMEDDEARLGNCILQHLEKQSTEMTIMEKAILGRVKSDILIVGRMTYTWLLGVAFSQYINPVEFNEARYIDLNRITSEIVRVTQWERDKLNKMVI